jgi:hypothetical protein
MHTKDAQNPAISQSAIYGNLCVLALTQIVYWLKNIVFLDFLAKNKINQINSLCLITHLRYFCGVTTDCLFGI